MSIRTRYLFFLNLIEKSPNVNSRRRIALGVYAESEFGFRKRACVRRGVRVFVYSCGATFKGIRRQQRMLKGLTLNRPAETSSSHRCELKNLFILYV